MSGPKLWSAVAIAVMGLSVTGIVRWNLANTRITVQRPPLGSAPRVSEDSLDALLGEVEEVTISNDPFRLANSPAAVRFDPDNENGINPPLAAPVPVRPIMTLKAIVGGPPWH